MDNHDSWDLDYKQIIFSIITNVVHDLLEKWQYDPASFASGCPFAPLFQCSAAELQIALYVANSNLRTWKFRKCLIAFTEKRMFWQIMSSKRNLGQVNWFFAKHDDCNLMILPLYYWEYNKIDSVSAAVSRNNSLRHNVRALNESYVAITVNASASDYKPLNFS